MEEEHTDLTRTNSTDLAPTRQRQQLARIDGRVVAMKGFRTDYFEQHLMEDHIVINEKDDAKKEEKLWCNPDCMARIIYGRTSDANRKQIRQRLSRQFREMLKRGKVLAVEFAPRTGNTNGEAIGFRFVSQGDSSYAQQCIMARLDRMRSRLKLTEHELGIAQQLLGFVDVEKEEPSS